MLSYALSTGTQLATTYFHLPFDEEEDEAIQNYERKYITWVSEPTQYRPNRSQTTSPASSRPSSPLLSPASLSSRSSSAASLSSLNSASSSSSSSYVPEESPSTPTSHHNTFITSVINENDLYYILGVPNSPILDKLTLRRAYLSRSRACHPDKFPGNPRATEAFQRVAVAYDVLSNPASRRRYDTRSPTSPYDVFAARPNNYAEETLRSVIIGVFNDFLDGDLEVIRSLLNALNDVNPGIKLGDDGIKSILASLHSIRERALTCRTCVYALHNELTRLLEAQHAFSQLSYFDILGRTRITIQLTRIAVGIPIAIERVLIEQQAASSTSDSDLSYNNDSSDDNKTRETRSVFPRHAMLLIRGIDVALDKMEKILK